MADAEAAQRRRQSLLGRRVGVVGLGREGVDLVRFLARHGATVTVSDRAPATALAPALEQVAGVEARWLLGQQQAEDLLDCDEIFVSPGVTPEEPVVAVPRAAGIRVTSATELFFELCAGRTVGITGSSGKTTTTSLVGAMLRAAGYDVVVGGNIGIPLLGHLDEMRPTTWCVLELSSFQLAGLPHSPEVAAVLNITPNHLDWHPDMDDYIQAKANIIRHQRPDEDAILNADDPVVAALPHQSRTTYFSLEREVDGAWFDGTSLWLRDTPIVPRGELRLRGLHNVANALAALAVASATGVAAGPMRATLRAFEPVPHRLEVVDTLDGVVYVNDSIATSPERSCAALRAIQTPIVLIAGGRDKHLPMEDWARLIDERARAVVLVGEAAPLIDAALDAVGATVTRVRAAAFAETVLLSRALARPGDTVLLSPGCTSFDEFRDFAARGDAFRAAVAALRPT